MRYSFFSIFGSIWPQKKSYFFTKMSVTQSKIIFFGAQLVRIVLLAHIYQSVESCMDSDIYSMSYALCP